MKSLSPACIGPSITLPVSLLAHAAEAATQCPSCVDARTTKRGLAKTSGRWGTYPDVLHGVQGHVVRGLLAIERVPQVRHGEFACSHPCVLLLMSFGLSAEDDIPKGSVVQIAQTFSTELYCYDTD